MEMGKNCCELVLFVSAISCSIADSCSEEQVELLAAVFTQLGDTLATLLTCQSSCNVPEKEKE